MGFHSSPAAPATTWAKFAEGKIVLSSKTPREGYVSRVNKAGNTVYEQAHDAFTGYLSDITISESEYGKQFVFRFESELSFYNITAEYSSRYAKTMLIAMAAPQYNPAEKVTLVPYSFKNDKDKSVVGVTLRQGGEKIPAAYDRTTLPPLREVKVKGNTIWDDTEVMDFLVDKLNTVIRPKMANPSARQTDNAGLDAADALMAVFDAKRVPNDDEVAELPF